MFILHYSEDTDRKKTLYCYYDLSRSSKVKGHGAKWMIICMFLSMNNSNYMSNRNHFKDIGTFLSKKMVNAQSRDKKCTWWPQGQCNILRIVL